MNLLTETKYVIEKYGYNPSDIVFIGSRTSGHACTWDEFKLLADIDYDDGYGLQEVASDLEIIFNDGGSLRRQEYDGAEWWEYIPAFVMPETQLQIKTLVCRGLHVGTIAHINDENK